MSGKDASNRSQICVFAKQELKIEQVNSKNVLIRIFFLKIDKRGGPNKLRGSEKYRKINKPPVY